METIRYDVKPPELLGKTEEQQARAVDDYVRESNRQIGIILRQIKEAVDKCEKAIAEQGGDGDG